MTTYGNEFRVFGGSVPKTGINAADATAAWSFVDSRWTTEMIKHAVAHDNNPVFSTRAEVNPHEIMRNPLLRAELELDVLEKEGGAAVFRVLQRIYPLLRHGHIGSDNPMLRHGGMHIVRRLRRMCIEADVADAGTLPIYTFTGLLSYFGVRISAEDTTQLGKLFSPGGELIDYRRFFALMESEMPEVRADAVKNAYAKLGSKAAGGLVSLSDIMSHWQPKSHPDVRRGDLTEAEGIDEFLRQWEIQTADGLVSLEVFMDYYGDISKATDNDEIFVELVRSSWNL